MVDFFSAAAAIALVGAVALAGGAPAMASAGAVRMLTASAAATNFFMVLPPWILRPNAPRIVPGRRASAGPSGPRTRLAPTLGQGPCMGKVAGVHSVQSVRSVRQARGQRGQASQ